MSYNLKKVVFILFTIALVFCEATSSKNVTHKREISVRIIGGRNAKVGSFPYQVSIEYNDKHWCGGSIIKSTIILTAAHCIDMLSVKTLKVRAGSLYRGLGGQLVNVSHYKAHPDFELDGYSQNDIAIIKLSEPLKLKEHHIYPIKLAEANYKFRRNRKAVITGWGYVKEEDKNSDKEDDEYMAKNLQYTLVPVLSRKKCMKILKDDFRSMNVCAGNIKKGGKDACTFDSGGPMVSNKRQIGIISSGEGCGKPGHPGVYTSVPHMRKWIDETISELESN